MAKPPGADEPIDAAATLADDVRLAPTMLPPTLASSDSGGSAAGAPSPTLGPVPDDAYELGAELARGGMGRILLARDRRLDRTVALKVLLEPDDDRGERFAREALLTARLEHPSIVAVHEAGRWPSGEPFYAMRRVVGRPLDVVVSESGPLEARLALVPHVLAIAEALAYAHGQRVIHRDLKPANVIVGSFGETVVLDWGLAKDLARTEAAPVLRAHASVPSSAMLVTAPAVPSRLVAIDGTAADPATATGETFDGGGSPGFAGRGGEAPLIGASGPARAGDVTAYGSVMGTPGFMPPEQAAGQLDLVDERADVYAIGAILYHVLAGRPPFEGRSSAEVLARSLLGPPEALDVAVPGVPEDLATICAKAMRARPSERYRTAQELAADLRRFLTGQLVASHAYSRTALVRRWVRARRGPLAVAAAALVLLAALGVVSVVRVVRERDLAAAARTAADDARGRAEQDRAVAEAQRAQTTARADELVLAQARLDAERDPVTAVTALAGLSPGSTRLGAARTIAGAARTRGIGRPLGRHAAAVTALAVSADGRQLVSAGADRVVRLLDLTTGATRDLVGHEDYVLAAAFSSDGTRLATGSYDKTVRLWDLTAAGSPPKVLRGHEDNVFGVAFTSDGRALLSLGADDVARVWVLATGQSGGLQPLARQDLASLPTSVVFTGVRDASISPDGARIALGGADGRVRIIDRAGTVVRTITAHRRPITWLTYDDAGRILTASEDGTALVTDATFHSVRLPGHGGTVQALAGVAAGRVVTISGKTVRLWDLLPVPHAKILGGHAAEVTGLLASPDGRRVVTLALDRSVRLWELDPASERSLTLGDAEVTGAVYASDHELITGDTERWVRRWDLSEGQPETTLVAGGVTALAVAPDGRTIAAGGEDGALTLIQPGPVGAGPTVRRVPAHTGAIEALAFSADGLRLASASGDRSLRLWDAATLTFRGVALHADTVAAVAFAGDRVVTACHDGAVRTWDVATGAERGTLATHSGFVRKLAVGPDGTRVASGGDDGVIRVVARDGGVPTLLTGHADAVLDLAWSPDGTLLASAGMDGTVRLWTFTGSEAVGRIVATHVEAAAAIAWSARGDLLASGGYDGVIRLTSPRGAEVRELRGHRAAITGLTFSPDGTALASGSRKGELFLWDLSSGERRSLGGHAEAIAAVVLTEGPTAGSTSLISASREGRVARWPDDLPRGEDLRRWLDAALPHEP